MSQFNCKTTPDFSDYNDSDYLSKEYSKEVKTVTSGIDLNKFSPLNKKEGLREELLSKIKQDLIELKLI